MPKDPKSQPTGVQGVEGNPNIIGENAVDVSSTMWSTERDVHMSRDARAATHGGEPAERPAFEQQGSDANHGKQGTSLPPWIG